jgi:hypothetical protein
MLQIPRHNREFSPCESDIHSDPGSLRAIESGDGFLEAFGWGGDGAISLERVSLHTKPPYQ